MTLNEDAYQLARNQLVNSLKAAGIRDSQVLNAMREVPRHIFVEDIDRDRAYSDEPLPLQEEQTISQPYIVAVMTSILLEGGHLSSVLEIGTGSGYQTAILAKLVDRVYSVERIKLLMDQAKVHLQSLGLKGVLFHYGDGYEGWAQHAPYEGIIVTASPPKVPPQLLQQLAEGGRMIIPIGEGNAQRLVLYIRHQDKFEMVPLEGVRFVPLLTGVR